MFSLCIACLSFITPWTTTVAQIPHPDHPGHIQGLS